VSADEQDERSHAGPSGQSPLVLVAMGGHAFIREGERGTIEDHERNAEKIAALLMTLVERDYRLIITHGNGPQVGDLLIQHERARDEVPALPLDVLVAMTAGSLGYILQDALLNQLRCRNVHRYVVTVVTQVLVDEHDAEFGSPSKPIGPFVNAAEAKRRSQESGWKVTEDSGRGWRRLVPSPKPIKVVQRHMIREAAHAGHIVIACGGGGIPIKQLPDGQYAGIEAVIDKDLTSSVLATDVGAALFIVLTTVPHVYAHFGRPEQRALAAVTLQELERLHAEGHFPPGSMGPKIEAVLRFLRSGGRRALITSPESLPAAIEGRAGTHFIGAI
jgi:carbamate kinase